MVCEICRTPPCCANRATSLRQMVAHHTPARTAQRPDSRCPISGHRIPDRETLRALHMAAIHTTFSNMHLAERYCWNRNRPTANKMNDFRLYSHWSIVCLSQITLIFMSLSSSTFSAFKSRCTTPLLWQYSTADMICANTRAASSSFIRPLATRWSNTSPRGAYSVTR